VIFFVFSLILSDQPPEKTFNLRKLQSCYSCQ